MPLIRKYFAFQINRRAVDNPRKACMVKILVVFNGVAVQIMGGHVFMRDDPQGRWHGVPLLKHRPESAPARLAGFAVSRAVSGRDQFPPGGAWRK